MTHYRDFTDASQLLLNGPGRRRKFDPDLAAWMRRAGIPPAVIAQSLNISEKAARIATRARPATKALDWCPEEFRADYRAFVQKVGAEAARRIVERDLMKRKSA